MPMGTFASVMSVYVFDSSFYFKKNVRTSLEIGNLCFVINGLCDLISSMQINKYALCEAELHVNIQRNIMLSVALYIMLLIR